MIEHQAATARHTCASRYPLTRVPYADIDFQRDHTVTATMRIGVVALLLAASLLLFAHGCHSDEDNELSVVRWQHSQREPIEKPRP